MKLALRFKTLRIQVDLVETTTTRALLQAVPFSSQAQTWGEEIYFATPVKAKLEVEKA